MKWNRQFWALVCFAILSAIPFVPVGMSLIKLRSSILFDQPILWVEGKEMTYTLPSLKRGVYELRLDSTVSDWDPTVKLTWELREKQTSREIVSLTTLKEIPLTRPVAKIHIEADTQGENELSVRFANSNPTKRALRLKVGLDRAALLESSSRTFGIVLAISLALSLLLWKPLMAPPESAPRPTS
jgi:hypothetical protein